MSMMRDDSGALRAIDASLEAALESRLDGAALRRVYDAVPATDAPRSAVEHEAAWAKLRGRLHDPRRTPFTDEVKAPVELVRDTPGPASAPAVLSPEGVTAPARSAAPAVSPAAFPAPAASRGAWRWLAVAASVVVVAGAGLVWANTPLVHEVEAGAAPQSRLLADGSTVWLAPGTQLSVSRRDGWPAPFAPAERAVRLTGEAYFEVARDGRPFVVRAPDVEVRVLGTRFTVRSGLGRAAARVAVSEGRVAVVADGRREELTGGQAVAVQAGAMRRLRVAPAQVGAWRTGGLAALDEPLGDVLDELARRYGVEITVDQQVNVAPTVSLFYAAAPSVDVVLGDLCTAQGLGFERSSRGYRVVQP